MLLQLRLWLARKLCPPTHRVERIPHTRPVDHEAAIREFEGSLVVESWDGRAR